MAAVARCELLVLLVLLVLELLELLLRPAFGGETGKGVWPAFETVGAAAGVFLQCQAAPTATRLSVIKNSHATGARRRRLRSCGAATGGGSCVRMPAHSAAGGSWP